MSGERRELPRTLTTFDAATVLLAITVGAGIFSSPQPIARELGSLSAVMLCWICGGLLAWIGALVYAEVGTRLPETGGELVYLRRGWGRWAAALFGWTSFLLIGPSTRVGVALVAADYLTGGRASTPLRTALAALLILALCALHLVHVEVSIRFQRALVALKLGGLAALVAGVASAAGRLPATAPPGPGGAGWPSPAALTAAMLLVFFSYLGWAKVGYVAGEIRRPGRSLPLALLGGVATVAAVYLATVWSFHRALGIEGVRTSSTVAADVAALVFGGWGGQLIAAIVVAAALSGMAGSILTDSRLYLAMARSGELPRWLDHLDSRFASPSRALAAHAALCLGVLALRQSFELHFSAMVAGRLFFIGLVTASLFRLRRADAGVRPEGVFRMPGYPLLPALFLAAVALLLAGRVVFQWREALLDAAILAAALPLFAAERWWRQRESRRGSSARTVASSGRRERVAQTAAPRQPR